LRDGIWEEFSARHEFCVASTFVVNVDVGGNVVIYFVVSYINAGGQTIVADGVGDAGHFEYTLGTSIYAAIKTDIYSLYFFLVIINIRHGAKQLTAIVKIHGPVVSPGP